MKVQLGAEGVDVNALMQEVQNEVQRRRAAGDYQDARIGRAERHNVSQISDGEHAHDVMLRCLDDCSQIDINDYPIEDRNTGIKGKLLVTLKTVIWKLLKFYTYRLWHQQNQYNSMAITAMESQRDFYEKRIQDLENRVNKLEGSQGES